MSSSVPPAVHVARIERRHFKRRPTTAKKMTFFRDVFLREEVQSTNSEVWLRVDKKKGRNQGTAAAKHRGALVIRGITTGFEIQLLN